MRNEKLSTVSLCFLIIAMIVGKTMKIFLRLLIESSIKRNEKLSLCFLIIAMIVCKIMKMY